MLASGWLLSAPRASLTSFVRTPLWGSWRMLLLLQLPFVALHNRSMLLKAQGRNRSLMASSALRSTSWVCTVWMQLARLFGHDVVETLFPLFLARETRAACAAHKGALGRRALRSVRRAKDFVSDSFRLILLRTSLNTDASALVILTLLLCPFPPHLSRVHPSLHGVLVVFGFVYVGHLHVDHVVVVQLSVGLGPCAGLARNRCVSVWTIQGVTTVVTIRGNTCLKLP